MPTKKVKTERREQAEERQKKYDGLSPEKKISVAKSRRGESKREINRIKEKYGV